ncbi:MAG: hypothetical protein Q9221_007381 [Calogaya cf. arnoldii]
MSSYRNSVFDAQKLPENLQRPRQQNWAPSQQNAYQPPYNPQGMQPQQQQQASRNWAGPRQQQLPANGNPGLTVYSNGNQIYNNQNPVASNRISSNGNPVPAKQTPIENLCAGTLYEIFLQDHQRSSTPKQLSPTDIDNKRRLCLSYVFQASAKLTPKHWRQFIDLLKAYKRPDTFEITRHNFGVLFEHAQNQELWDNLLSLAFPQWTKDQENWEQRRYARYQKQGRGLPIV